jgi:anti-sigma factor RsiW
MRANGKDPIGQPDRALWRQSVLTDVTEDDAACLLDLAGFADDLLDPDDRERVAEWLAGDLTAAADVAAARVVAALVEPFAPAPEAIVARACGLVAGRGEPQADNFVVFPAWRRQSAGLRGTVQWGGLAAAVAVAAWLGFTLGIDTSRAFANDRPAPAAAAATAGFLNDLLDTQTSLVGDLGEGSQT